MKQSRLLLLALASTSLVGFSAGCFSRTPGSGGAEEAKGVEVNTCVLPEDADRLADRVLQLVNLERAASDKTLPPVVMSERLNSIAAEYACLMIEDNFFDHYDPYTGRGPAERAVAGRYPIYSIGETLAAGPATAAGVVESWMQSPSHRDIILDPNWTEVGIAVRHGGEYSTYWVQMFADPAPAFTTLTDTR